jgi:mevalonate pyrophosphate decarboxylase
VIVCVVSAAKKEMGSTEGMNTSVDTSELLA